MQSRKEKEELIDPFALRESEIRDFSDISVAWEKIMEGTSKARKEIKQKLETGRFSRRDERDKSVNATRKSSLHIFIAINTAK